MKIAADADRDATFHSGHGRDEAVMLFQPALLPVRLRFSGGKLTPCGQYVGISFHPLARSPAHGVGGRVDEVRDFV